MDDQALGTKVTHAIEQRVDAHCAELQTHRGALAKGDLGRALEQRNTFFGWARVKCRGHQLRELGTRWTHEPYMALVADRLLEGAGLGTAEQRALCELAE